VVDLLPQTIERGAGRFRIAGSFRLFGTGHDENALTP
jgi:hypothetical protein